MGLGESTGRAPWWGGVLDDGAAPAKVCLVIPRDERGDRADGPAGPVGPNKARDHQ